MIKFFSSIFFLFICLIFSKTNSFNSNFFNFPLLSQHFVLISEDSNEKKIMSDFKLPNDIYFHVYRNEQRIGYHKVTFEFEKDKKSFKAKIEINFNVKFLGFVVYEYEHFNTETWSIDSSHKKKLTRNLDNKSFQIDLNNIKTKTNKNGTQLTCEDSGFGENSLNLPEVGKFPTSYWNSQLVTNPKLSKTKVLNTQDCNIIELNIDKLGRELIYKRALFASRYKLTGKETSGEDLNIDVWYDDKGNWVKMIFVKDGSKIEYYLDKYNETK